MSWWVYLYPGDSTEREQQDSAVEPLAVERFSEGGTQMMGGNDRAELNVTYNYGRRFREAFDGLHFKDALHNQRAEAVTALLQRGVECLGTETDDDYWASTPGNAGAALALLLAWAKRHPTGVFVIH